MRLINEVIKRGLNPIGLLDLQKEKFEDRHEYSENAM